MTANWWGKLLTFAKSVCYSSYDSRKKLFHYTGNALGKTVKDRRCPAAVTVDEIRKQATGTIVPGRRGE